MLGKTALGKYTLLKSLGSGSNAEVYLERLLENPRHPGLQTHEYHSKEHPYDSAGKVFEAYVQNQTPGAYRLFWCYGPGRAQITLIAIIPHP